MNSKGIIPLTNIPLTTWEFVRGMIVRGMSLRNSRLVARGDFMKLSDLKNILAAQPEARLRFLLPNGEFAPAHIHVTEVARVDKRFIDCGGTLRTDAVCRLQMWHANDVEHRLTAGKLMKIFAKAEQVLLTNDLDVDVEHEVGFISQFPVESVEATTEEFIFRLGVRHTACLAEDKCLPPPKPASFDPMKFDFSGQASAGKCCA